MYNLVNPSRFWNNRYRCNKIATAANMQFSFEYDYRYTFRANNIHSDKHVCPEAFNNSYSLSDLYYYRLSIYRAWDVEAEYGIFRVMVYMLADVSY